MAFINSILKIKFLQNYIIIKLYSFIKLRFRLVRPWFYNDMIFSLSPQGRKQKNIA